MYITHGLLSCQIKIYLKINVTIFPQRKRKDFRFGTKKTFRKTLRMFNSNKKSRIKITENWVKRWWMRSMVMFCGCPTIYAPLDLRAGLTLHKPPPPLRFLCAERIAEKSFAHKKFSSQKLRMCVHVFSV